MGPDRGKNLRNIAIIVGRESIFGLEERTRGILYAAIALGAITLVATGRMWDQGGGGAILWLAFLGLAVWGLVYAWRAYREY